MFCKGRLTARRAAVDTDDSPLTDTTYAVSAADRSRISSCAELNGTAGTNDPSRHRPPPRFLRVAVIGEAAGHIGQARTPETAARRQEGHRFKQIGLAGAVCAGQNHRPGIEIKPGLSVAAKIRQRQST
jgi:hypothetical protein